MLRSNMDDLKLVRRVLSVKKRELDDDVPNHGYDSALALSAKAGGLQDAIDEIDVAIRKRETKGRKFKVDRRGG